MDDRDDDGNVVLVVRATQHIKANEQVLVHYNPGAGIGSWGEVFQCRCCQCKRVCKPTQHLLGREEEVFKNQINYMRYEGQSYDGDLRVDDFVRARDLDCEGNVSAFDNDTIHARGFCKSGRKLVTNSFRCTRVGKRDRKVCWTGASADLRINAIVKIWESKQDSSDDDDVHKASGWKTMRDGGREGGRESPFGYVARLGG